MLLVCYPNCSTCKKAQKWLEANGCSFTHRNIKTQNPTDDELKRWHKKSGLPLKRFYNTSGASYRTQNVKEQLPQMSDNEQLQLLSADGMLLKRPILVSDDIVLVGFKEDEWSAQLL